MILPIDLRGLVPADILDSLNPKGVQEVMRNIAEAARAEWVRLAGQELRSSAPDYLRAIQRVRATSTYAVVSLVGDRAMQIEDGHERIEQKHGLLGPKVPVTEPPAKGKRQRWRYETRGRGGARVAVEDGYYRAVPFRHATPGTRGQVGTPIGDAYRGKLGAEAAALLGKAVYGAAKRQLRGTKKAPVTPTITSPYGGKTRWGARLDTSDVVYKRKPVAVPKLKEYHTTDIYAGMYRMQKEYESATQGYYQTFRMIAVDASGELVGAKGKRKHADAWTIPKKEGKKLASRVHKYVERITADAFKAYLGEIG